MSITSGSSFARVPPLATQPSTAFGAPGPDEEADEEVGDRG
jgi:hypothetical protein